MPDFPVETEIEYTDFEGSTTRRAVTIRGVYKDNGREYLDAFCHSRRAPRQFRTDRVDAFISEDGELLEPGPVLDGLRRGTIEATPARQGRKGRPVSETDQMLVRWIFRVAYASVAVLAVIAGLQESTGVGVVMAVFLGAPLRLFQLFVLRAMR